MNISHRFLISKKTRGMVLCAVFLLFTGCAGAETPPPTPTLSPEQFRGSQVFTMHCAACHATSPETIIVGPSLAGIADRAGTRMEGFDSRQYIETSIMNPNVYKVEGFNVDMPADFGTVLTGDDFDDLVEYLLTLTD